MEKDQRSRATVIDVLALARASTNEGPIWSYAGDDLNANLVRLEAGEGVTGHVNAEVEVLLVGVLGTGIIEVDGCWHDLGAGQVLVIPKGTCRAIEAGAGGFAYLTCHRRRPALWPENVARWAAGG